MDSLAGSGFELRINGAAYSGFFDDKGKIDVPFPGKNTGLKVAVSPTNGIITIKISGATLAEFINPNNNSGKVLLPVVLGMEFKHYHTCEAADDERRAGECKTSRFNTR